MADLHREKAIMIYRESLRLHKEAVSKGVNPDGTDTWKGNMFDADKIAKSLIAPHIDKGNRELIRQKWIQRMDEREAEIMKTPVEKRDYEMSLFNRTKISNRRWYSDTMVRRALQLEIEI